MLCKILFFFLLRYPNPASSIWTHKNLLCKRPETISQLFYLTFFLFILHCNKIKWQASMLQKEVQISSIVFFKISNTISDLCIYFRGIFQKINMIESCSPVFSLEVFLPEVPPITKRGYAGVVEDTLKIHSEETSSVVHSSK